MFVLGLQVGLLVVYLASTADRTLVRKLNITWFEIGQAGAAFLVSIGGALYLADATEVDRMVVGTLCALFSVVAYVISFRVLEHSAERRRNFHAYSIFAVALMLVACRLLLTGEGAAVAYAALSVCAAVVARSTSVRAQAAVFLVSAALTSHAITAAGAWLIQTQQTERLMPGAGYAATLIAACAYFRRARSTRHAEAFASSALLAWLSAGFAAAWLADPAMRTGVLAAMSILLAAAAARYSSRAFAWTAYVMLGTAGVKLVVEDLRLSGQSFAVFVSLALFGSALILVPRILRGHGARGWKVMAAGPGGPARV
jgi:hypothetical protein